MLQIEKEIAKEIAEASPEELRFFELIKDKLEASFVSVSNVSNLSVELIDRSNRLTRPIQREAAKTVISDMVKTNSGLADVFSVSEEFLELAKKGVLSDEAFVAVVDVVTKKVIALEQKFMVVYYRNAQMLEQFEKEEPTNGSNAPS